MNQRPPHQEPSFTDPDPQSFSDGRPPGRRKSAGRRSEGSVVPWVLLAILVAACGLFALLVLVPMRDELRSAERQLTEARGTTATLQHNVIQLEKAKQELEQARDSLAREVEGQSQDLQAVQTTQEELVQKFQSELASGDILIRESRGELVVDLVDKVLFDSGEALLNPQGKKLLRKVADSLIKIAGKIIEVRGHTDALPITGRLHRQFPTNWELSTQRASNVVRFLQEDCAVPGERLVAAGFSQYHPAAANSSKSGRARNRRIEVVLLPRLQGS